MLPILIVIGVVILRKVILSKVIISKVITSKVIISKVIISNVFISIVVASKNIDFCGVGISQKLYCGPFPLVLISCQFLPIGGKHGSKYVLLLLINENSLK